MSHNDHHPDGHAERSGRRSVRPSTVRAVVRLAVLIAIVVGLIFHVSLGTYSSFGIGFIASICPLGALESIFGSWAFVPRLVIALVAMVLIVLVVGRAFCAWVCPVPPISSFLKTKRVKQAEHEQCKQAGQLALARYESEPREVHTKARFDSRYVVLGGALGSAAIFGFPVFCLVCPVGLTCATILALIRLVGYNEPTWGLVVFPLIIVAELVLCRKFCAKICPIAALMSLVARASKTFIPTVDESRCKRTHEGEPCHACSTACPSHIDPHSNKGLVAVSECTRCMKCAQACPGQAIHFPFLPKSEKEG